MHFSAWCHKTSMGEYGTQQSGKRNSVSLNNLVIPFNSGRWSSRNSTVSLLCPCTLVSTHVLQTPSYCCPLPGPFAAVPVAPGCYLLIRSHLNLI